VIATALAIVTVVLGAVIIIASARPRVPVIAQPAARDRARDVAQLARRLELAHNLAGRLLQTRWNPRRLDLEYVAGGVVDSYQRALVSAWIMERAQLLDPLLELEELLERMESFTARVRSWRPGRARGKR
jgi:7,8-dihydro-6-hydroxymethylpterin-pyrophosphokinase